MHHGRMHDACTVRYVDLVPQAVRLNAKLAGALYVYVLF